MASSSSSTSTNSAVRPPIRRINDTLYEFYKPESGFIDVEIIFFHGIEPQNYQDAYVSAWKRSEDSDCWINTWLPEDFRQARIMSVSYDSSSRVTHSTGRMDMDLIGENLVQSIIGLEGMGQKCPVVLVGHCIGGLVLKQVCLQAETWSARHVGPGVNKYKIFLRNMRAVFFFSTPNTGSRLTPSAKGKGPLLEYLELLNNDAARLSSSFAELRHQRGWKTRGVCEANETNNCRSIVPVVHSISRLMGWSSKYSHVVEEGSARYDVDDFLVLSGEDHFSISKPRDKRSNNYVYLVEFIQEIIRIEKLQNEHWLSTLRRPQVFVATPSRVEEVIRRLQLGKEEPSRIALVGMGGIGKTTLAKEVLMRIREQFDFTTLVEDVKGRLTSPEANLYDLLAKNLYLGSGRKLFSQDLDAQSLRYLLLEKRVLILLDDVDSEDQITEVLSTNWLGTGSRLIVTSRVQNQAVMPTFSLWKVPLLSREESETLFLAHLEPAVIQDVHEELIEEVVQKCEGLPLTLAVIGSYLRFEKKISKWKSTLEKLARAESLDGSKNDRLWAKLKISYDDLAPSERKMFLDLAVIHESGIGKELCDLEMWIVAWSSGMDGSSVEACLDNLVDRSLIQIHGGSVMRTVWIHEQMRDMGKNISRPTNETIELCRGAWRLDDVTYLLSKYKGDVARTQVLWADQIATPSPVKGPYRWSFIAKLSELRLLRLSNVFMKGNESHRFPCRLAVLHLTCVRNSSGIFDKPRSDCWPIREEDVDGLPCLSMLCLENCSPVRLPSNFHKLSNLKVLVIRGKDLKALPEKFGRLRALEVLILDNVELSRLPNSFFQLPTLRTLTLKRCSWFDFVPKLSRGEENAALPLCSLTILKLEDLPSLTNLPDTLSLLQCLEALAIEECHSLKQLPESLGNLVNLKRLKISGCFRLEFLCESLGKLASLGSLVVQSCGRLRGLPDSAGQLRALTDLELVALDEVVSLPESIGNLQKLNFLCIGPLRKLERLPETMENFRYGVFEYDRVRGGRISQCREVSVRGRRFKTPKIRKIRFNNIDNIDKLIREIREFPIEMLSRQHYEIQRSLK